MTLTSDQQQQIEPLTDMVLEQAEAGQPGLIFGQCFKRHIILAFIPNEIAMQLIALAGGKVSKL